MTTRNLLSGPITLSDASRRSSNVLHALRYPLQTDALYRRIESQRALIAEVVAHHLGTKSTNVLVSPQEWWRHGSFNLCLPVRVDVDRSMQPNIPEFVFIRFPLPYRVGEATRPGNSDEKLNCEAATYAWLQENCPSVPIPRLYGFGLSTNQRVRVSACARPPLTVFSSLHISTTFPGGLAGTNVLEGYSSPPFAANSHPTM